MFVPQLTLPLALKYSVHLVQKCPQHTMFYNNLQLNFSLFLKKNNMAANGTLGAAIEMEGCRHGSFSGIREWEGHCRGHSAEMYSCFLL